MPKVEFIMICNFLTLAARAIVGAALALGDLAHGAAALQARLAAAAIHTRGQLEVPVAAIDGHEIAQAATALGAGWMPARNSASLA